MEVDIQNYSQTVMFHGTPCIFNLLLVKTPNFYGINPQTTVK